MALATGRKIIYFHGAPGAPAEAELFDDAARAHGVRVIALDRFAVPSSVQGEAYYRLLATQVQAITNGEPVVFVGFSIGAFVALQTSRYMVGQIKSLHLVSAAAPLDGGDFLKGMAGKPVFQLARAFPLALLALSYWQSLLARWFPKALFGMLFASAQASDRRLADEPQFQARLIPILQSSFSRAKVRAYVRDIAAYVQPWRSTLAQVQTPTYVWHGTQDNWSPPTMAVYLQTVLPHCQAVHMMDGLSHYGCLLEAVPQICAEKA